MTGFINPNSIKLHESSDHKKVIYSHLDLCWRNHRTHIWFNEIREADDL